MDPGLAADLLGVGPAAFDITADGKIAGAHFETLVITEIHKQATWSEATFDLAHFRDRNGPEVDLVIEERCTGQVAGVEIKLTATPAKRHARYLALLLIDLASAYRGLGRPCRRACSSARRTALGGPSVGVVAG